VNAAALPDLPAAAYGLVAGRYRLRTLSADDVEMLVALDRDLFGADAWPETMFRDELAHPEWRRYWALVDSTLSDDVVGYLGLQYSPRIADVQTIGVTAAHRRRGLADLLMRLAEDRAAAWGAESMMLEVRVDNDAAIALYARHGFETIHTRAHYYGDGTDALIMARPVTVADRYHATAAHDDDARDEDGLS
jgi:ribosomal-protein-alanine N-acetyltransferase